MIFEIKVYEYIGKQTAEYRIIVNEEQALEIFHKFKKEMDEFLENKK